MERYYIGIDAGSVSVNAVVINNKGELIFEYPYKRHFGGVETTVFEVVHELYSRFGLANIRALSFTGNHGRIISDRIHGFYEFESIAQILGAVSLRPDVRTVISMGGQDTALYILSHNGGTWELTDFNTNGPCASGTGSFIDQQAERLASSIYGKDFDTSEAHISRILEDFITLGLKSKNPARVACRCTVFTKSDMIHLQNKGEKLEDIIAGLHEGNASNYLSTIVSNRALPKPMLFIGGLTMNELQVRAFRDHFRELIVPRHSASVGALGVALQARELDIANRPDLDELRSMTEKGAFSFVAAPRLELIKTDFPEDNELKLLPKRRKKIPVFLGIDVGSTTTKYALISEKRGIIDKEYRQTMGKPIEVTQSLLRILRERCGGLIDIKGVATTGSGRMVVGDFLNADLIIDEITAHARGAIEIDPLIDTVFEIGGQDSKYISISNTHPLDFDMNKVCAAGTGSFLHELANKNSINIVEEFQRIALSSKSPIKLTERCTVFMESDLVTYAQKGGGKKDLIAGLCYAIVYNYLNRVVGNKKVGERIMFLGGPSLNKAIVAAFEAVLGKGIVVPKHREVLGGFGAAISVQEKMKKENKEVSSFRGIEESIHDTLEYKEAICHADPQCHNECKLKIYNFSGRKSIWGGECGRYEIRGQYGEKKEDYFKLRDTIWERHLKGLYYDLGDLKRGAEEDTRVVFEIDGRPTVGMQRALYTHQLALFWASFFDALGYRVVLTPKTNDRISKLGIESMTTETCFPVKVSHGHVIDLLGNTQYLFLPNIIDVPSQVENKNNFYCPMVQGNQYMLKTALGLKDSEILNPTVHLKYSPDLLSVELHKHIGKALRQSLGKIREAIDVARGRQQDFENELYSRGAEITSSLGGKQPLIFVTGRPYNLFDEKLNLRLGQNLSKIGMTALPMDFIDIRDIDLSDFPNMYWAYGYQVLQAAKLIKLTPNFFGLHLTNFSCGPDSFNEHFYKYIMGHKPYLILELDEHTAVAGVMTRLQAFKNVIQSVQKMESIQPQITEVTATGS
ncbi:MAG: CoA activase [Deltaproteobacteria bacterium]|nr:MAG: CoA activase [Deltaproteobacteria bacterium]